MIRTALIVMAVLLAAAPVLSQPARPDSGEQAYREGRRLYDLREWDQAIVKFKEAYKIRSDAPSMFNIAQSYRLKGDCIEALSFYRTYKRNFPTAPNIGKVNGFIVELEPCARTQAANPRPQPTVEDPKPSPLLGKPEPTHVDTGRTKRLAGLVIVGSGVLAIATGTIFGLQAKSKSDDVSKGGGMWDPTIEDSAKRSDLIAKISWSIGGAAIATGVVVYFLGRSAERTQVAVVPHRDGAMVVWGSAF